MYLVNDIEFLIKLNKYKILDLITPQCIIAISEIRLLDYSSRVRKDILETKNIQILKVNDDFNTWVLGRRKFLSISDLSTLYIAKCETKATIVITDEDELLINQAETDLVNYVKIDEFISSLVKDERTMKLYDLIKAA